MHVIIKSLTIGGIFDNFLKRNKSYRSSFKASFIISFVAFVQFVSSSKFPKVGKLNFSFILVSSSTFLTSWPLSNELNRPKI